MKIKKLMSIFLGVVCSVASVWATVTQADMSQVTTTYKAGFYFQGVVVPLRLWELGLLGIIVALIIASLIESKVISRMLGLAYKQALALLFLANGITAIAQWVIVTCIKQISVVTAFLEFYIKQPYTQTPGSVIILLVSILLFFIVAVVAIKMAMQYFLIRRYHTDINDAALKKSIVYANLISFGVLCLLEVISYHIPTKTITYVETVTY